MENNATISTFTYPYAFSGTALRNRSKHNHRHWVNIWSIRLHACVWVYDDFIIPRAGRRRVYKCTLLFPWGEEDATGTLLWKQRLIRVCSDDKYRTRSAFNFATIMSFYGTRVDGKPRFKYRFLIFFERSHRGASTESDFPNNTYTNNHRTR